MTGSTSWPSAPRSRRATSTAGSGFYAADAEWMEYRRGDPPSAPNLMRGHAAIEPFLRGVASSGGSEATHSPGTSRAISTAIQSGSDWGRAAQARSASANGPYGHGVRETAPGKHRSSAGVRIACERPQQANLLRAGFAAEDKHAQIAGAGATPDKGHPLELDAPTDQGNRLLADERSGGRQPQSRPLRRLRMHAIDQRPRLGGGRDAQLAPEPLAE